MIDIVGIGVVGIAVAFPATYNFLTSLLPYVWQYALYYFYSMSA